ncbi:hypothetical protein DPMN_047429 [Dreissena polymorpha]|uniref:Uncharacterized protein n=1 Tax=Dreissena polymorpha TaxID=45954 RepID=A0A9D4D9S5_DREPO|nr:hypothetical protein DPMN_047429 [Dreissena polymorpha]
MKVHGGVLERFRCVVVQQTLFPDAPCNRVRQFGDRLVKKRKKIRSGSSGFVVVCYPLNGVLKFK